MESPTLLLGVAGLLPLPVSDQCKLVAMPSEAGGVDLVHRCGKGHAFSTDSPSPAMNIGYLQPALYPDTSPSYTASTLSPSLGTHF